MSQFPTSFRHIHLELAREAGHPEGDAGHGYDIVAPLAADGRLDADEWKGHREKCRVRRFRPHEDDEIGTLLHGPGGRWFISYVDGEPAESGYRFEDEHFVPGEYVSIREDDGEVHTFRVMQVRALD